MSDNPYAPPSADVETPRTANTGGTGDFLIGQCLSDAWAGTWSSFPLWLGVGFVLTLLMLLSGLTVIGIFIVWPLLAFGAFRFLLNVQDGRAAFADLWTGFEKAGSRMFAGLGLMFLLILLSYVGQIPTLVAIFMDSAALIAVGYVINFAWTVVMLRFNFAIYLWVENDAGPIEALGNSWRITSPVKWKLVGLVLVAIAIVMVPMLVLLAIMVPAISTDSTGVLVVGSVAFMAMIIPASMLGNLIYTSAYRQVVGQPEAAS